MYKLKHYNRPIVNPLFEKWYLGATLPEVYISLRHLGSKPITHTLPKLITKGHSFKKVPFNVDRVELLDRYVIEYVLDCLKDLTARELAEINISESIFGELKSGSSYTSKTIQRYVNTLADDELVWNKYGK